MKARTMTFWDRLKPLFTRRQFNWDHDTGLLTVYKVRKGITYLIAQEPIAYGDPRNHQLDRWGL